MNRSGGRARALRLLACVAVAHAGITGCDDASEPIDAGPGIDSGSFDGGGGLDAARPLDGAMPTDGPTGDGELDAGPGDVVRRVPITIGTSGTVHESLRLTLTPSTFSYGGAAADGSDLRFSTSDDPRATFDVGYWIESWDPSGESVVWLHVPGAVAGQTIYAFYGFPGGLAAASSFADAFPTAFESSGIDDLSAGTLDVDAFVVHAGHSVNLPTGSTVTVRARYVSIEGRVEGAARGYAGGTSSTADGRGPGGGGVGSAFSGDRLGAGGGGYGGMGGSGAPGGGAGGAANGDAMSSSAIDMGSGGGYSFTDGGRGGGAITIEAQYLRLSGVLDLSGRGPVGAATCCYCPGAGAGGGALLRGYDVSVTGSIAVQGGVGGGSSSPSCGGFAPKGGGGGSGGRVKIFGDSTVDVSAATILVTGGTGGLASYGVVSSRGGAGADGTFYSASETFADAPPTLSVGTEQVIPF